MAKFNGTKGDDVMLGFATSDHYNGGAGNDTITTGDGNDRIRYMVNDTSGHDVITDFDVKTRDTEIDSDTLILRLRGEGWKEEWQLNTAQDFADFIVFIETDNQNSKTEYNTAAVADGTDLVFYFGAGESIRLQNVLTVDDNNLVTGFRGVGGDAQLADSAWGDGSGKTMSWIDAIDYSYPDLA